VLSVHFLFSIFPEKVVQKLPNLSLQNHVLEEVWKDASLEVVVNIPSQMWWKNLILHIFSATTRGADKSLARPGRKEAATTKPAEMSNIPR
jgi:hypothetical protein